MNQPFQILFQTLIKPFYKENAGAFIFVFTMMFCIISKVDGASVYEYHYILAAGMLKSTALLLLVFLLWLLYARKCGLFVVAAINNPYYSFLQVYNQRSVAQRFRLFFLVNVLLLLPIGLYSCFVAFVGIDQRLYVPVAITLIYLLLLCITITIWHVYELDHMNKKLNLPANKINILWKLPASYPFILIRFVAVKQTNIWIGLKVFTCGILYLIARNNNELDHDISLAFLFYSFGVLANGVLIFNVRIFEETYLHFYKSLPVSAAKRWMHYSILYCFILLPEMLTILLLTPVHLYITDAVNFVLCGYSLLLLMNSFTFLQQFTMKDYISLLLATFFVECILLITAGFIFIYLAFFIVSLFLFFNRYYKAEQLQHV